MKRTIHYCSVQDCDKPCKGQGLCPNHYYRYKAHGHTGTIIERHGMVKSPEYRTWAAILTRCHNPNTIGWEIYKDVEVYELWRTSFTAFYKYVGDRPSPKHSIDRIRGNEGYVPGNVRWVLRTIQNLNRKMQKSNTSGYRGVSKHSQMDCWVAIISCNNEHLYLGIYKTSEEAALAYDAAAIQLYGNEAKPNILC